LASKPDRFGERKPAEYWIERIQHADSSERSRAVFELSRLGPKVKGVISALIGAIADEDFLVRSGAARALGEIGPEAFEAAPALVELLSDSEERIRNTAAEALAKIGPECLDLDDKLTEALNDPSVRVRVGVARALWSNERNVELVFPVLVGALQGPDPLGRANAALTLLEMGAEGREAGPTLRPLLKDKYEQVRFAAATALRGLVPESQEPVSAILAERERRKWMNLSRIRLFLAIGFKHFAKKNQSFVTGLLALCFRLPFVKSVQFTASDRPWPTLLMRSKMKIRKSAVLLP
jgi:HEAT repeat protein